MDGHRTTGSTGRSEKLALTVVRECYADFGPTLAAEKLAELPTIVDIYPRFCPAADPRLMYRGEDVVRTLEQVCARFGYPKTIRVDNGADFTSEHMAQACAALKIQFVHSWPGRPSGCRRLERFFRTVRDMLKSELPGRIVGGQPASTALDLPVNPGRFSQAFPQARDGLKTRLDRTAAATLRPVSS